MRLVALYLIGYAVVVAGAVLTLWTSGILARLPAGWVAAAVGFALALGVLLALVSRAPGTRPRARTPPAPRAP